MTFLNRTLAFVLCSASPLAFGGQLGGAQTYNIYNFEGIQLPEPVAPDALAVTFTPSLSSYVTVPSPGLATMAPSAAIPVDLNNPIILSSGSALSPNAPAISSTSSPLLFVNNQQPLNSSAPQNVDFFGRINGPHSVPEPATWILTVSALASFGFRKWRTKRV